MSDMDAIGDILNFWFVECEPRDWFVKDPDFDAGIKARFGDTVQAALDGGLSEWTDSEDGCLALILALDQFPRNIFRDTPRAFAGDARAVGLVKRCTERGYLSTPDEHRRQFMLMPLMHSEDIAVHEAALPLFAEHTGSRVYDFAVRHRDIIARFGRYPHRNGILGRASTPEELAFLTQPGSSF
jgi:uncharacterized protein (DUF924 family)